MTTLQVKDAAALQDILGRAAGLRRKGRIVEAMALYRTVLALDPINTEALRQAGAACEDANEPQRGLNQLLWFLRLGGDPGAVAATAARLAIRARRPYADLVEAGRRPRSSTSAAGRRLFIGVKPAGHDSAIFVVDPDRRQVLGLSCERLTRHKHDAQTPTPAFLAFIDEWGLDPQEKYEIVLASSFIFYEQEEKISISHVESTFMLRKLLGARFSGELQPKINAVMAASDRERLIFLLSSPLGRQVFAREEQPESRPATAYLAEQLSALLPGATIRIRQFDHQACHALSAWASFPEPSGLSITMDGVGNDKAFSRVHRITAAGIEELAASAVPSWTVALDAGEGRKRLLLCSPGGVYAWFTEFLGFAPNADEGKVEALAAFGKPIPDLLAGMVAAVRHDRARHVLDIDEAALARLLAPAEMRAGVERHGAAAMAATVQRFLEETTLDYVRALAAAFDDRPLFLSGGVFANVILNLRLFEEVCSDIRIAPAMADDGSAQGAAVAAFLESGGAPWDLDWLKARRMPYFGTAHGREAAVAALIRRADAVVWADMGGLWPEAAAERLAQGQIGAVFHGRMEWGPRALGNRSILADPRPADIRERLNRDIKRRPPFQPFCPSILLEERERLFENAQANPHMTCAFRMRPEHHAALPGAIHIDGTARVQFVDQSDNPAYWRLLRRMKALTGYGVVLNTSFNKHGRTIVESPDDALTDFLDADLDFMCIEGLLVARAQA